MTGRGRYSQTLFRTCESTEHLLSSMGNHSSAIAIRSRAARSIRGTERDAPTASRCFASSSPLADSGRLFCSVASENHFFSFRQKSRRNVWSLFQRVLKKSPGSQRVVIPFLRYSWSFPAGTVCCSIVELLIGNSKLNSSLETGTISEFELSSFGIRVQLNLISSLKLSHGE